MTTYWKRCLLPEPHFVWSTDGRACSMAEGHECVWPGEIDGWVVRLPSSVLVIEQPDEAVERMLPFLRVVSTPRLGGSMPSVDELRCHARDALRAAVGDQERT